MAFADQQPEPDDSDVQQMWIEAITQYCRDNKKDPKDFQRLRDIKALQKEHNDLVDGFAKFRHHVRWFRFTDHDSFQ